MAIRTFNSVGGFSVGEIPTNVIDPNGAGTFTSIKTDNLFYANGNVWDLQQAAGSDGYIQFNTGNNFAATANLTFVTSSNYAASLDILTVNGNLAANNLSILSNISAANISSANITGNMSGNFSGNMSGNFSGNITGGASISAPGSDTQVVFNDGNTIEAAPGLRYIKGANATASSVEVSGNLSVGVDANIIGALSVGTTLGVTGLTTLSNANITTDLSIGNTLSTNNFAITGVIIGDLIPNSHYTQNLGNATNAWKDLWLSGNTINLGTQTLQSTANGTTLSGVTSMTTIVVTGANTTTDTLTGALVVAGGVGIGGNIYAAGKANIEGDVLIGKSGAVASANVTGNLQVGGDAAVTGNLAITGDLTVGGNTTYVNTTNTSITDAIIDLGGSNISPGANITGPAVGDRGLLLHGSNSVNQFMGWNTGVNEFQLYTDAVITAGAVAGNLSTLRLDTLQSAHVYGTIETSIQPNVTTMLGLVDTTTSNTANITIGKIATLYGSGLKYPTADGTVPALNEVTVLQTDGNATLGFSTIHTDRIANATSNIFINLDGSIDVTANGILSFSVIDTGANVIGALDVSTSITTPTANVTTVNVTTLAISNSSIYSASATSSTVTPTVIATVDSTTCRAVDFFVKGENITGEKYTVATITAIHDGATVDYAVHSKLHFGDIGAAGAFSVAMDGTDITLSVTATSSDSTSWVTQIRTI